MSFCHLCSGLLKMKCYPSRKIQKSRSGFHPFSPPPHSISPESVFGRRNEQRGPAHFFLCPWGACPWKTDISSLATTGKWLSLAQDAVICSLSCVWWGKTNASLRAGVREVCGVGCGTVRGKALAPIYKPSFLSTINQFARSLVSYFSVGST